MVWLCVTFKFVCFDGIEGKKLADEVVREKGERKKENKKLKKKKKKKEEEREFCGMLCSLEEVVGKKKEGRKIMKRVRVLVWRRKKEKERRRKYG